MKIGLDVGGSHIAIGAINDNNEIILKYEKDIKISETKNPEKALYDNIVLLIEDMLKKISVDALELIGISCPRKYN